jgi:hypothetical protein
VYATSSAIDNLNSFAERLIEKGMKPQMADATQKTEPMHIGQDYILNDT